MKILALETSGQTSDLSILDTKLDKVWEKQLPTLKGVSEVLTTEIEDLLKSANIDIKQIDLIAVGIGPGSYTGTRVGIATAKGLAQGLNIPLVGVNSFEALIEAVDENYEVDCHPACSPKRGEPVEGRQTKFQEPEIVPLIDARNNRVYYQINGNKGCDDICEVLEKLVDKNYVFVGTGATANQEIIKKTFGEQSRIEDRDQIQSRFIAQLADGRAQNNLFDNIVALKPLYINNPKIK